VLGHSNGGFMAYRMACDHADVIAAIASLEGAMIDPDRCDPSEPVSVLEIHGTADKIIRYGGGTSPTTPARYPSVDQTVGAWVRDDRCRGAARPGDPATRSLVEGLRPALVQTYPGCSSRTAVQRWTQPGGDHMPQLSATFTQQVIDFFLAHPKR
jgi:polyhydroxybutyrate depolymerase